LDRSPKLCLRPKCCLCCVLIRVFFFTSTFTISVRTRAFFITAAPEEPCPGLHVASWGGPPRVILGGFTDTRPGQHEASWVRGPGLHVASWGPRLSWEPGSSVHEAFWDLARPTTVEDLVLVTVFTSVVSASSSSLSSSVLVTVLFSVGGRALFRTDPPDRSSFEDLSAGPSSGQILRTDLSFEDLSAGPSSGQILHPNRCQ
jgi:hypothetical protein